MEASGEGGAAKNEVGGVLRCSETQLEVGVASGCAIHPASKPRGISLLAITANQHSKTKVGSDGCLSIVQGGGPMVGRFTEGEVAVANRSRKSTIYTCVAWSLSTCKPFKYQRRSR